MSDNIPETMNPRSTTPTIEELATAKGNGTDEAAMKGNGGSGDPVTKSSGVQTPEHLPGPQQQANTSSPFDDMVALRKSNKAAFEGEREGVVAVTLDRPKKELFVRFHEDEAYYLPAYLWAESDDSRAMYYITNTLWDLEDLQGGLRAKILAAWLGADGSLGIWPVPAASSAGTWYDSGQEILAIGRKEWVRIQADNSPGQKRYRYFRPKNAIPDQTWPDISLGELLKRAFGTRVVENEDHPLIRRLRNV
jgi:hypothetical protein